MEQRRIGPFGVSAIGLGCMGLSHAYGEPPSHAQAQALLGRALDLGVSHFDTAALYGFGANEELVGAVLRPHRSRITLATKGGMAGVPDAAGTMRRVIDGRPEAIRRNCEDSLARLKTEVIDLYYLHRLDRKVPVEDSVGALGRLVRDGKVRAIGLSEVSAQTLRRAHAVHPLAAVQNEYSLWTRNAEIAVLDACRELGIGFVAFSPIARGFLSGRLRDVSALHPQDLRRTMPRFAPDAYAQNLRLLDGYNAIAREAGCTPAQLAIAWLLAKDRSIVPLTGTTKVQHLEENIGAAAVELEADLMSRLEALINPETVVGARYSAAAQADIDTEDFD